VDSVRIGSEEGEALQLQASVQVVFELQKLGADGWETDLLNQVDAAHTAILTVLDKTLSAKVRV